MSDGNGGNKLFFSIVALIFTIIAATVSIVVSFENIRHDHTDILKKIEKPCP